MDEIVFSVTTRGYALARATRDVPVARVFIVYGGFEPRAGRLVATHTLVAPPASQSALEAAHREAYPNAAWTRDGARPPSAVVEATTIDLEHAASPETFAFHAFPPGTLLGPAVVREGRMVLRAVVPGGLDMRRVQEVRDEGARNDTWTGFQILRSGPYEPALSVEAALAEELTPKQLEVVRTALALGYYDSPRRITLHHLSELYGISKAAAHNRLQAAERKIMLTYFQ